MENKIEEIKCEKCGEETGIKSVADESYNYCESCNHITN